MTNQSNSAEKEITVEEKLRMLYELQTVDSKIDEIRNLRGELPLEVRDLEDDVARLETRIKNYSEDLKALDEDIKRSKMFIDQCMAKIKKYEADQGGVRNNREYDYINKEIEFEKLEIELAEKHIREFKHEKEQKTKQIDEITKELTDRQDALMHKRNDLSSIIAENEKDEAHLLEKSKQIESVIEPRLIIAYKRIRNNANNGLGIVTIERSACGGCFSKIPPQRQLDVRLRRKIMVCEHCGRILVDNEIAEETKL
ncbi:MAG TPA: hypothetical protein DCQ31_17125 [Bacteroidales bacterium]|nr:hypothetical protein [Bacteroidales bacterium]